MSEAQSLKVGIIGCGGNGRAHLQRLAAIDGVEIAGIADPSTRARAATREVTGRADLASFRSHAGLLEKTKPDAILISTPHSEHYQQIIDALAAGCHVLCEKPMVCSVREARRVIKKAEQTGLMVGISYQRHLMAPYLYCRQTIAAGEIGKVHFVSCLQSQNWYRITGGTWRQQMALSCGGQLNDSGSHLLDIVLWMTGLRPESVFAYVDRLDTGVDILTAASVSCAGGALWNFSVVGESVNWMEDITIWGEEGTLAIRGSDVYQWRNSEERERVPARALPRGSTPDENFIAAIRGQTPIAAPPEDGLPVIELTEAIWQSGKSGQPETVGS